VEDWPYLNRGPHEARKNGDDVYILGHETELFLRPGNGTAVWRVRRSGEQGIAGDLPADAVRQVAHTLSWIAESLVTLRAWAAKEAEHIRQRESVREQPPGIHPPDTSIRIPHLDTISGIYREIGQVSIAGDFGKLILTRSGTATWHPGGLSSGPVLHIGLPEAVVQEALHSSLAHSMPNTCVQ